jgi:hypothetical protein
MRNKVQILLIAAVVLAPFLATGGVLLAATRIPIGTFNPVEKQRLASRQHPVLQGNAGGTAPTVSSMNKPSTIKGHKTESIYITDLNTQGVFHVNKPA